MEMEISSRQLEKQTEDEVIAQARRCSLYLIQKGVVINEVLRHNVIWRNERNRKRGIVSME